MELLNIIEFDWSLNQKKVVSWEVMYDRLLKFKQEYGHTGVPVKWLQNPKFGKWVSRMRQGKEIFYPKRISLLEGIEFDWGYQFSYIED